MAISEELEQAAKKCAKCGACTTVCPLYQVSGRESLTARGKVHLLARISDAKRSATLAATLAKCLLCGACADACPRGVNTPDLVIRARGIPGLSGKNSFLAYLSQKILASPNLFSGLAKAAFPLNAITSRLPQDSGLRLKLALLDPEISGMTIAGKTNKESYAGHRLLSGKKGSTETAGWQPSISYFTGCFASHLSPTIGIATEKLLKKASGNNPHIPTSQTCCGLAAHAAGNSEEAKRLAKKNIAAFEQNSLPVVTSCASCYVHLTTYPMLLADDSLWLKRAEAFSARVCEFSTFFSKNLKISGQNIKTAPQSDGKRIVYHDPCHLRFKAKITSPPRELLAALPNITLLELPNGPQCCGQGGLFHLAYPKLATKIRDSLLMDFATLEADMVTTTCSGCLLQWQHGLAAQKKSVRILHLAALLADLFSS